MNSNHVVFKKNPDVVFKSTTEVMCRAMQKLGIREITGEEKKKWMQRQSNYSDECQAILQLP